MAALAPEDVMALAGALSVGEPETEVARLAADAAARTGAPADEVRAAALGLLLADPAMLEHFGSLEAYLEHADEDELRDLALPLAGEAALAAAAIDLERAMHEAGLYIDSYPKPGLAVEGDLAGRASSWLAERLTMTEDASAARPRMRRAVAAYSEAAAAAFPLSARGLGAVVAADPPEDPLADDLWQALAQRIVARRIVDVGW